MIDPILCRMQFCGVFEQLFDFYFFSSWDEWVPESRVLKYVDTNLQKQKELQKANQ